MISDPDFPRLTPGNHRVTSPATPLYNCIAWSVGDADRWWQPGVYWPIETSPDEYSIETLEKAFESLGYLRDDDGSLELGFEKVLLYGSGSFYSHASRQLADGRWTSMLGGSEDIEHDFPEDVAGGIYGELLRFMKRPVVSI